VRVFPACGLFINIKLGGQHLCRKPRTAVFRLQADPGLQVPAMVGCVFFWGGGKMVEGGHPTCFVVMNRSWQASNASLGFSSA
jgi:hypothetical protein